MKALNTMVFVTKADAEIRSYIIMVEKAETYEEAKEQAAMAIGYVNGLTTFSNAMICKENNEFTAEYSVVLDNYMADIYQALAGKADTPEETDKLLKLRSEYRAAAEE